MPQDVKIFRLGGMNTDDAIELLAENDFLASYNIRVTGTSEAESGTITNPESNSIISGTRSSGINKGIGAAGFEVTRTAYFFIYNSQKLHIIGKLDYDTGVQSNLYVNLTNSNSVDILTLTSQYFVNDIKLINDIYLAWTDSNMQPCLINLDRLESGGYGTLTLYDLLIIKAQSLIPPTAVYGDDVGQSVNLIQGKLFQFRNQLEYQDYYRSAGSTWSKRPVPASEATPSVGTDVTVNNNIVVSVDIGTNRVETVNIWAHYGNLDWFTIKTATRAYILALPAAIDIATQVYEAYDPATNLYSIVFYNDGMYENVDVTESDLDYDHVPLKCESLENVNGDILALAGITEGYDRPEVTANFSVVPYNPSVSVVPPTPGTFDITLRQNDRIDRTGIFAGSHYRIVTIRFVGTPLTGDVITIKVVDSRDATAITTYVLSPAVTVPENGDRNAVVVRMGTLVPSAAIDNTVSGQTDLQFRPAKYYDLLSAEITYFNVGTSVIRSVTALKSNSSYQLALAHFDYWGRYFPLVTGKDYILNTQSYAQSNGLSPQINWAITSSPPTGAVSAQWLISKNNTHENNLMGDAVLDVNATAAAPGYFVFNINPLKKFNQNNSSSVLGYDFTEGDRCTFMFYYSSGTTAVWFNNPAVDVEVGGFEITLTGDYLLKVRKSSSVAQATITGKNLLLELYTPRLRTVSEGGVNSPAPQVFYEIGEEIPIENDAYTVTSGQITDGDVYFKIRQYVGAFDPNTLYNFPVEDFNYSDFYPSKFTSYGRPRTYQDEVGSIERKASIRYSDEVQRATLINGLNRFFPDSIYGDGDGETSSNYGWIRKIRQRGNMLIAIHEIEVAYVPVFISIVEDQQGSEQYALSLKLFNKARYSGKGFGMGNAKESYAEKDNNLYFFDQNKSEPIRIGLDGISVISGKMSMFFKRTGQAAMALGKKIIGYFDLFYDEYLIATENLGDIVNEPPFDNADYWQFDDTYVILPAGITNVTNGAHGTTSYDNTTGIVTYTPTTGYDGTDNFTFDFMPSGGVPTTKRVCMVITAGTATVLPFAFLAQTGIVQSTVTESNTILVFGNNIPVAISIAGGTSPQYSINGGSWTNSAGTVDENDYVQVRQTSSASLNTLTTTTLTIAGVTADFNITTVTSIPNVDIVWTANQSIAPYVMQELRYSLNGSIVWQLYDNDTGTVTVPAGSTVEFRQISLPTIFPWPDNGTGVNNAQLAVNDGATPLYNNTVQAQVTELHGANYGWVTVAGHSYTVNAQTFTTMTGFDTYDLLVNTFTVDVEVELEDDTTTVAVISLPELNLVGANSYMFNVLTDANTITANFTNNSSEQISIAISGHSPLLLLPAASGSVTGIVKGNITVDIESVQLSILSVDYYDDANVDVCAYIDTVGVAQSGNIISAIGALNFYEAADPAATAYMLSSDNILIGRLRRRFEWNIDKLNDEYPDAVAIPTFVLQIRGRSTGAGACEGVYSMEYPGVEMIMTGSLGSYIPSTDPTGGPTPTAWNSNVASGADGTVGTAVGSLILTFTYTRATNSIAVTTY